MTAKDTILFDGQCRFCQAHIRAVQRAGGGRQFAYVSLHDPEAAKWVADIAPSQVMREMYVITRSGHRLGGIDAVRYVTRRLPLLWPFALILHIPGTRRLWGLALSQNCGPTLLVRTRVLRYRSLPTPLMLGSASVEDNEVYNAIGEEGFQRLVSAFYRQVPADDILGPMYPKDDMDGAEERLRDFLIFRFGGPQRYIERARPPATPHASRALRSRTGSAGSLGTTHGQGPLRKPDSPEEAEATLRRFFDSTATFMMNRA